MPKQKDLKRLTRARMGKTGEAYTTARAQLLAKKARSEKAPAAPPEERPDHAALAGMSDQAVEAATGRDWAGWVALLDAKGAAAWPHREIAAHLRDRYGTPPWWTQMVTVGYERIKGLRERGQRRGGHYEANKSKTFPVPLVRLYDAFQDPATRRAWLPGVELTVRKATPERSMRVTWEDGTSVEAWFVAKGDAKSQVQLQHTKLASKADAEARKAYWGERLAALAAFLAGQSPA